MEVKRIKLNSQITFDFFHFETLDDTNADIFVPTYKPSLNSNSISLICFDDGYENIYDSYGVSSSALGYTFSVYREENSSNDLEFVSKLSEGELSLVDYNIKNGSNYIYYVYKEDDEAMSVASLTSEVKPEWWDWSVVGIYKEDPTSTAPIYKVDPNNIWKFALNVESGTQTQTFNKTVYDTLAKYPKVSTGNNNYSSGSLSFLLGSLQNDKYIESVERLSNWNYFCASNELKLLRDRKGNSWIIEILDSSSQVANESIDQYNTIMFNWVEVEGIYGTSITE